MRSERFISQHIQNQEEEQEDKQKHNADFLMDKFLETRTILLSGTVNKELAERVIRQLLILEQRGGEPIKVMIDSPGGDVDAGCLLYTSPSPRDS